MFFNKPRIISFISQAILVFSVAVLNAQSKHALLIGVGKYPAEGGWNSLNSNNDIRIVKSALIEKGFEEANIYELRDENATRQGILQNINDKLRGSVNKGDMVYLHFSGHGQQKRDFDGDEIDGYDECLVPFDSPKKFVKGVYEGENLITDDELGQSLNSIREKIGNQGQLLVVLDACHSGTGTRGFGGAARGGADIMADPKYVESNHSLTNKIESSSLQLQNAKKSKLSPMVAFFGSAQNQLNYEMATETGERFGSLSYAVSKNLVNADQNVSYRGMFDKIRTDMAIFAPNQSPQSEGDLDLQIANGKLLSKPNYFLAFKVNSENELVIRAGQLHGLQLDAEVGLFPQETRDLEKTTPLVKGKITKSFPAESIITLEKPLSIDLIKSSWIFLTEKNFGAIKVSIGVKGSNQNVERKLDEIIFSKNYFVKNQIDPKIWLEFNLDSKTISYSNSGREVMKSQTYQSQDPLDVHYDEMVQFLRSYLHGDFIRKLELEGTDIRLSFKIIPIENITDEQNLDNIKALQIDEHSEKKLTVGSKVRILISNEGLRPAYYTLLDIQPDNIINVLIPQEPATPEEMRILPDQKILFNKVFEIYEPLGKELFKLIASDKPIDLRSSLATRGIRQLGPFEKLFNETKTEEGLQTRSINAGNLKTSDIHIHTDVFTIIKTNK